MKSGRLAVGSSVKNENILWATGFFAPDEFIFLEVKDERIMVVSALEYGRAKKEAKVDTILLESELPTEEEKSPLVSLLKKYDVEIVVVNRDFPAGVYRFLSIMAYPLKKRQPRAHFSFIYDRK